MPLVESIKLDPQGRVIMRDGKPSTCCCGCGLVWDTSVYYGQLYGNPWVVSNGGNTIRVNVEDSWNCGGSNWDIQTAEATATIKVGANDVDLDFSFSGIAEEQEIGFENILFYLNWNLVAIATSPGSNGGAPPPNDTCNQGPAVTTYFVPPPYRLPAGSVNLLKIYFTTGDGNYHQGSYYEANFTCKNVEK